MKKFFCLLIALSISALSFAQEDGDLENQFYFRFGLSLPTNSYLGVDDNSVWDQFDRIGGVFELGSIFMLNSLPLADGLRLGINVDYAQFSYHQFSFKGHDSKIGVLKVSSKIGPSISWSPVNHLVFDGYVKAKIPWVAGMVFLLDGEAEETYGGTLGIGFSTGINVRYRFLMVGFEYGMDKMKLEDQDNKGSYFGSASDDGDKTPMSSYNFTFGFTF